MKKAFSLCLALVMAVCLLSPMMSGQALAADTDDGWLVNISENTAEEASVFSTVAVNPKDPSQVTVAWRIYGVPIDTTAPMGVRVADFHLSVSDDGGRTFTEIDMMPYVRAVQGDDLPQDPAQPLWYCNGPWASYGADGLLYFGTNTFTALGDTLAPEYPKQGRALLFVSEDNGKTFSEAKYGIRLDNFAEDAVGLNVSAVLPSRSGIEVGQPGTDPWHTPWDGCFGIASATTDLFVSTAGSVIVASHDGTETFEQVHAVKLADGWKSGMDGTVSLDGDTIIQPFVCTESPLEGLEYPCLAVRTSSDDGLTWSEPVIVAQASEFSGSRRFVDAQVRYPISATSPVEPGHWAIASYTADHKNMKVFYTEDAGATWQSAEMPATEEVSWRDVKQVSVGYTANGELLTVWRGFQTWGSFYTLAALQGEDGSFAKTVLVSPELSVYPFQITQGNYMQNLGGGDFVTWITGGDEYAYVAFPYTPDGEALDTFLAVIPLDAMK